MGRWGEGVQHTYIVQHSNGRSEGRGRGEDVMMAYDEVQHRQAQGECVYIHIPACI